MNSSLYKCESLSTGFSDNFSKVVCRSRPITMELSPCPIFVDAEQCRSPINAFSYGFVAPPDISQFLFVVNSVMFLAIERGVEENVIIVLRTPSAPVYFQ